MSVGDGSVNRSAYMSVDALPAWSCFAITAACVWLLLLNGNVDASTIFNNSPHEHRGPSSVFADQSAMWTRAAADDFELSDGKDVLRNVYWEGIYAAGGVPNQDNFQLTIYHDHFGSPGEQYQPLEITSLNRSFAGRELVGLPLFQYLARVRDAKLIPGERYWLGIANDTDGHAWGWSETAHATLENEHYLSKLDGQWHELSYQLVFRLGDARIPEPTSAVLVVVAACCNCARLRCRSTRDRESASALPQDSDVRFHLIGACRTKTPKSADDFSA